MIFHENGDILRHETFPIIGWFPPNLKMVISFALRDQHKRHLLEPFSVGPLDAFVLWAHVGGVLVVIPTRHKGGKKKKKTTSLSKILGYSHVPLRTNL